MGVLDLGLRLYVGEFIQAIFLFFNTPFDKRKESRGGRILTDH